MHGYFGNMLKVVIKERILHRSTKWLVEVKYEGMHKVICATKLMVDLFHDCKIKKILFRSLSEAEAFVLIICK